MTCNDCIHYIVCKHHADLIVKAGHEVIFNDSSDTENKCRAFKKDFKKINTQGERKMENKYFIVRTNRAGVFFGKIKERSSEEVTMTDVRKIWHWDGACAVEQIAMDGVKRPGNCKFTVIVPEMTVMEPIQIIPCTDKAAKILSGVDVWQR